MVELYPKHVTRSHGQNPQHFALIVAMSALLPSLALAVLLEARHYAPAEGCDTVLNAFCEAECSGPPGVKYARLAGWWQGSCGEPSVYNSDARSRDEGCIKWLSLIHI